MNLEQIDYAPLQQIKDVLKTVFFTSHSIMLLILCAGISLAFVVAKAPGAGIIVSMSIYIPWLQYKINKTKKSAWSQFAAKNNWEVLPPNSEFVPPALRDVGHSHQASEIIDAKFNNLECFLLGYNFTVGSGKNEHTYFVTIAALELPKALPHIILDSLKNAGGLREIQSGMERLKLEGDFNDYFALYLSKGEEIDVLSIISPDVMQTLIDSELGQDIEIFGKKVYFVAVSEKRSPDDMKALLNSVNILAGEIMHRVESLKYTPMQQP